VITFDPDTLRLRLSELEEAMGAPGFWDDQKKAAALSAEHARLSKRVERYDGLASEVDDLEELLSISSDEELDELEDSVDAMRRSLLRRKLVEVQLAGDVEDLAIAGAVVERLTEHGFRLVVDTERRSVREVLDELLEAHEVDDISVVDPPLEDVIGRIYARPVDEIPG